MADRERTGAVDDLDQVVKTERRNALGAASDQVEIAGREARRCQQRVAVAQPGAIVVPGIAIGESGEFDLADRPPWRCHQPLMQGSLGGAGGLLRHQLRPEQIGAQEIVARPPAPTSIKTEEAIRYGD